MYPDTDLSYARLGYRPNIPSMQGPTPYRTLVSLSGKGQTGILYKGIEIIKKMMPHFKI